MKRDYPNKNRGKKRKNWCGYVPQDVRKHYHSSDRIKRNKNLYKIKNTQIENIDDIDINFPGNHRHSALWDYW